MVYDLPASPNIEHQKKRKKEKKTIFPAQVILPILYLFDIKYAKVSESNGRMRMRMGLKTMKFARLNKCEFQNWRMKYQYIFARMVRVHNTIGNLYRM